MIKLCLLNEIMRILDKEGTWRGVLKSNEGNSIIDCFIQLIHSDENIDKNEILVTYVDITERIKLETELNFHKINDIKKKIDTAYEEAIIITKQEK